MITYKLTKDGLFAEKFVDGIEAGEWANTENNQQYLQWLSEGNTPEPADNGTSPLGQP